jgi:hypothetical protein
LFALDAVASVTAGGKFAGRARAPGLRFSASPSRLHPRRLPSRLTSRSSRPHIVASTACFTLRYTLLPPPLWDGLTPALGGRKAFGGLLFSALSFFGFGQHFSPDKFSALSASVTSLGALTHRIRCVGRLRKLCFAWSTFPRLIRPLRKRPAESSRVRVRAFPLRLSVSLPRFGLHRHPPPPNNSFKPTPCRGIVHVLYATLAHVRRPNTGRLNSGVRRH